MFCTLPDSVPDNYQAGRTLAALKWISKMADGSNVLVEDEKATFITAQMRQSV